MIALSVALVLSGCSTATSNDWTGFYYPDKDNIGDESTWVIQPGLSSLEACRNWIDGKAGSNSNFDYECGNKCRFDDSYKMTICKETLK